MELNDSNTSVHVYNGMGYISLNVYIVIELNDINTLKHVDNGMGFIFYQCLHSDVGE